MEKSGDKELITETEFAADRYWANKSVILTDEKLFSIASRGRALHCQDWKKGFHTNKILVERRVKVIEAVEDKIICAYIENGIQYVAAFDQKTLEKQAQIQINSQTPISRIYPLEEAGAPKYLLLVTEEHGAICINIEMNRIIWSIGAEEEWCIMDVVDISFGVILLPDSGPNPILLLDKATGQSKGNLPDPKELCPSKAFEMNDGIFFDMFRGPRFFEYTAQDS